MSVGTAKLTSAMESALISLEVSIASATIECGIDGDPRKEGGCLASGEASFVR